MKHEVVIPSRARAPECPPYCWCWAADVTAGIFTASAEWSLSIPAIGGPNTGHSGYLAWIPSAFCLIVCCTVCNIISPPTEMCSVEPPPPLACPGTGNVGMTPPLDPTVGPHRHRPHHRDIRNPRHLTAELPAWRSQCLNSFHPATSKSIYIRAHSR